MITAGFASVLLKLNSEAIHHQRIFTSLPKGKIVLEWSCPRYVVKLDLTSSEIISAEIAFATLAVGKFVILASCLNLSKEEQLHKYRLRQKV